MKESHELLLSAALHAIQQSIDDARQLTNDKSDCGFLATTGENKQATVRMITVLAINDKGLMFLANKNSGKVKQFSANPDVGLCFYWPELQVQTTIEGNVRELDRETSETLWQKRDYHAQITAWAIDSIDDKQSADPLHTLDKDSVRERFSNTRPPLATSWAGYIIEPSRIEFWGTDWRKNKKRSCYFKQEGEWQLSEYY